MHACGFSPRGSIWSFRKEIEIERDENKDSKESERGQGDHVKQGNNTERTSR